MGKRDGYKLRSTYEFEVKQEKSYPCKILSGNRITIPKEIMKSLNLKVGDLLMKKTTDKGIIFVPCKVVEI